MRTRPKLGDKVYVLRYDNNGRENLEEGAVSQVDDGYVNVAVSDKTLRFSVGSVLNPDTRDASFTLLPVSDFSMKGFLSMNEYHDYQRRMTAIQQKNAKYGYGSNTQQYAFIRTART